MFEIIDGEVISTKASNESLVLDTQTMTIVYGLLLREDFRRMLIHTKYGRDYFTDSNTHVRIPESVGCYRDGATWLVYETDERGTPILECKFTDPLIAYQNAASRRGLQFTPSESTQSVLRKSLTEEHLSKVLREIRLTIRNLEKVDQILQLTGQPDAVKEDIQLLVNVSERFSDCSRKKDKMPLLKPRIYKDKTIVCQDCGKRFVFTAGEQEFYAERGFQSEPQRCMRCRENRKVARKKPAITVCPSCGKFIRNASRGNSNHPTYCSECIKKLQAKIKV